MALVPVEYGTPGAIWTNVGGDPSDPAMGWAIDDTYAIATTGGAPGDTQATTYSLAPNAQEIFQGGMSPEEIRRSQSPLWSLYGGEQDPYASPSGLYSIQGGTNLVGGVGQFHGGAGLPPEFVSYMDQTHPGWDEGLADYIYGSTQIGTGTGAAGSNLQQSYSALGNYLAQFGDPVANQMAGQYQAPEFQQWLAEDATARAEATKASEWASGIKGMSVILAPLAAYAAAPAAGAASTAGDLAAAALAAEYAGTGIAGGSALGAVGGGGFGMAGAGALGAGEAALGVQGGEDFGSLYQLGEFTPDIDGGPWYGGEELGGYYPGTESQQLGSGLGADMGAPGGLQAGDVPTGYSVDGMAGTGAEIPTESVLGAMWRTDPLGTVSKGLGLASQVGRLFGPGGLFGGSSTSGGALAQAGAAGAIGPSLPSYPAMNRQVQPYGGDWLKYGQALPTQTGAEHQFFMRRGGALSDYGRRYQRGGNVSGWTQLTSADIAKANTPQGQEELMNDVRRLWEKTMQNQATPEELVRVQELGQLLGRPTGRFIESTGALYPRAEGGSTNLFRGAGGGQDDLIDARVADGEYIFDAEATSAIGDGSNEEGARRLDAMRERLRAHKRGGPRDKIPPKARAPETYMKAP